MNNPNNVPDKVREELNAAIADAIENRKRENEDLAKRTFCRKSPLSIETVMKLLISMHGGSLKKELLEANVAASASAFVQKRNQISWLDMEYILESFNERHKDAKTFRGFHVYAVDGTTVNLARNPRAASFVQHAGIPDGVNQLHVTPLYDVLAKTYQHVVIQNQSRQNEVEALRFMLDWHDFPEKVLIVGDRAFQSYNIFATFIEGKKAGKEKWTFLGIQYVENYAMGTYPCIKCNIGHDEYGETKIYHLPFDQQYDATKIKKSGEFYAMTVAEAENAGFRRTFKWFGNK